ncbi:hypothetical protein IAD21_00681 [Abditibacteriota bacterium]|nr:hypothetical protein IAD21_00681 [Abditibacteriota bacterium]
MSKFPLEDNLHTELDGDEFEFSDDELRQHVEDLIRRGELEPGPSLLERYVHPLTGDVLIEGGPDTPETRAAREETARWWSETVGRPWHPKDTLD